VTSIADKGLLHTVFLFSFRGVLVALVLFSSVTAAVVPLDTPEFTLEFDDDQGRLVSLIDKESGHEHIVPDAVGSLWVVELPEDAGGALRPSDAASFTITPSEPGRVHLAWSNFGQEIMPGLSVEVTVIYEAAQGTGVWNIIIRGLGNTVPTVVRFPRFPEIAKQESEVLAVPYWMGEKTTRARQYLSPAPGESRRRAFSYPGLLSLQCMAFYRDGGPGVYLAADDSKARSKSFAAFGDGKEGLGLEVCHFPGADALSESTYTPGYSVRVGVFQGDWLTAAERYRRWALEQSWARESRAGRTLSFTYIILLGMPISQTLYAMIVMNQMRGVFDHAEIAVNDAGLLLGIGIATGLGEMLSAWMQGLVGAAGIRALSEGEGKGLAFVIIAMGIVETVGIFTMVFMLGMIPSLPEAAAVAAG